MEKEIDLFSYVLPKFKIDKPIRLIELFAGIGSQAKALERLGVDFTHYKIIEWDKHCINSYNAIHGTNFETSDISKVKGAELEIVEKEKFIYIMTYSFPCQDLSLAGKGKGMKKGSGTRSGLLWEVERLLDELNPDLPQILMMENVPQVIGKKNIKDFQLWRKKLEELGYSNYVELLNAKHYGIPQNRNRCFMISILGNYYYEFPKRQKLNKKLKDLLEDNVDEKYYLQQDFIENMLLHNQKEKDKGNSFKFEPFDPIKRDISRTITTKQDRATENYLICPNGIKINNATSKGYLIAQKGDGIDISSRMQFHRGTVQKNISQTLKTNCEVGVIDE